MVALGVKNLVHTKSKSIMSIVGVALSLFLVVVVYGVYDGMNTIMEKMVTGTGASVWITQEGTSGSVHSPSLVDGRIVGLVASESGVSRARGFVRSAVTWEARDGSTVLLFLNGFDTESSLGAPWNVAEGAAVPEVGEIVVDRAFAKGHGFSLGEEITVQGETFRIAGLTNETNVMVGYQAFVRIEDARRFLPPGLVNAVLIQTVPSVEPVVLAERLQSTYPSVNVSTSGELVEMYQEEVLGSFRPIILLLSGVSILVGVLVVGLLIYLLTLEKAKEYTILKAAGASDGYLYRVVLAQAVAVSVVGAVIGAAVSPLFLSIMRNLVPEFVARISTLQVLVAAGLFAASGAVSSLIPLRVVRRIDPALAFRQ